LNFSIAVFDIQAHACGTEGLKEKDMNLCLETYREGGGMIFPAKVPENSLLI
jgi:hypothetical protein